MDVVNDLQNFTRDELFRNIQQNYVKIISRLKVSDIHSIVDHLFERFIFNDILREEVQVRLTSYDKATHLVDNIMKCDKESIIYFINLIKYIMPDVYQEITGIEGIIIITRYN